jgi:hypothetical protein
MNRNQRSAALTVEGSEPLLERIEKGRANRYIDGSRFS